MKAIFITACGCRREIEIERGSMYGHPPAGFYLPLKMDLVRQPEPTDVIKPKVMSRLFRLQQMGNDPVTYEPVAVYREFAN